MTIEELLAHGVDYEVGGKTYHEDWEHREDWQADLLFGQGAFALALDWECSSCRPEVGWPKWDKAVRDWQTGEVTIHIECGHCGGERRFLPDGSELEEDW